MSSDTAIRVGQKAPNGYKKIKRAACPHCGATFSIIHEHPFANADRAKKQATAVQSILRGEHVDPKFQSHLQSYDLENS